MTTRTLARLAAAATAAALLLAGCTQPAGDDPAAKAAIAYYTSRDTRTAEQCDFEWSYRSDPTKLASCKADPGGGYSSITGMQVLRTVDFPGRCIVFAEVVHMHVRDTCIDPRTLRVLPEQYRPVARMHGDWYVTAEDWYELRKPPLPGDGGPA